MPLCFFLTMCSTVQRSEKGEYQRTGARGKVRSEMSHGNEDPLADPVAVIVTLQQYQQKLASQVELLRQDVATSKTFQAKYGVSLLPFLSRSLTDILTCW